jgi:DNA-directed RNA polymerase specialized sigma24 family protein
VADESFNDLASSHGAALLRLAYLLSRDTARAEDPVQDALIKSLAQ